MSEYYCPNCGADLEDQPGFDPDSGYWTCTECGQFLTDPEDEDPDAQFDGVGWFCDGCGAFLNRQDGFNDWCGTWTCTECGYENRISEDEIYESEEDYQSSKSDSYSYNDEDEEDEDDEDPVAEFDGVGWQCNSCYSYLNEQAGFDPWCGTWTCQVCGQNNQIPEDDIYQYEANQQSSSSYSYSSDDSEDDDDSDEDYENEDNTESYFDSEEYKRHQQEMARRRAEAEARAREERLRREEEQRLKAEQRKERRQRIWRTVTGKKQNVGISSNQCCKMRYDAVIEQLKKQEFYNFNTRVLEDLVSSTIAKEGMVESISFNGTDMFDEETKFPYNAQIDIVYHVLKRIKPPITSKAAKRRDIEDVMWEFTSAGFENVEKLAIPDLKKGWIVKEDSVENITIDGKTDFKKSDRICVNAKVVISYHVFKGK